MNNLIFFDKEGHSLNFNYNSTLERYEGDLIFHENSSDTFKTQAVYTFEEIKSFEFENQSDLTIRKWQLFNEFGFNFYEGEYLTQSISKIEPVNLDSNYSSKWIYGHNFHRIFPLGTLLRFNQSIFEFTNVDQSYTVVSLKKGSILVMGFVDNATFDSIYPWSTFDYTGYSVSAMNVIGVRDYIDFSLMQENLSNWNEMGFYDDIYKKRKLNIVNSELNDKYKNNHKYEDVDIVTVKNENLLDINRFEYSLSTIPLNTDLWIEVVTKTDLPLVYSGGLVFDAVNGVLKFTANVPKILKPGMEFKIPSSLLNTQFFTVAGIPNFVGNSNLIVYNIDSQVLWNNRIYQCIQSYTWVPISGITPDDSGYWSSPTFLPLSVTPVAEILTSAEIYLTTDHLYFTQSFTYSSDVTLASAAQKFSNDLSSLNIDLYFDTQLNANLIYPTNYAIVNFYGVTQSFSNTLPNLGSSRMVYERAIEVEEQLVVETNYNISSNFDYNIVFTDLDDYGFTITVNKEVYPQAIQFLYSSGSIDMPATIDKTLTEWISQWGMRLLSLGIISSLQTIGISPYYNSIKFVTEYPNVPLSFKVDVGSEAFFYIEHSLVTFYDPTNEGVSPGLGNFIDIRVNNRSYGITYSSPLISQTLQDWVDEYSDILSEYGIFVENGTFDLQFNVQSQSQRCDIEIRPGISVLPGDFNYEITPKFLGNMGCLLTSNEIILGTSSTGTSSYQSFEDAGFATGMVTGINGTVYPLQDVEFNVLFLDPQVMNLSYEGPFWGLTSSTCVTSPFFIISFSNGFGQTACSVLSGTGGMFSDTQFSYDFNLDGISGSVSVSIPPVQAVTQSSYGTLGSDYTNRDYLWIHTRDYIRKPRVNFNDEPYGSVYWKWFSDNTTQFFLYDFSGDYLPSSGSLAYTGPKPLSTIHLNKFANRDKNKITLPEYQQTIFPILETSLDHIDDEVDISLIPSPLQTFIGFNSVEEGAYRSILQLFYKENINFTINTYSDHSNVVTFKTVTTDTDRYGVISLDPLSNLMFLSDNSGNPRGLKVGQHLAIFVTDVSNKKKQYISSNNGYLVKIRSVGSNEIIVDFFQDIDAFSTESSVISDFPKIGQTTYLSVKFRVWDREIGRFNVYGQSEIEDIRYKTELGNVGKLVSSDDVYIYKEYDIKEEGIDWTYLNKKRKEMLMMKNVIYPYIGSYKSIINAINHFGYNDLELSEYYRNIDVNSPNYNKLFKVEIPDIFDNTVEGWKDNDFIKHTFPNVVYQDTNLFNLTYRITDKEGNNILNYSLEEVQKKLQGLKYWLQKNIIPITHKILDITGRADFVGETTITHIVRDITIINHKDTFTPVSFKLNELYLMPVNNGSTVYNCVLDFYLPQVGATYSNIPDYYTVDIRSYEIYREWYPFKNYMIGDKITYYDKLYESVIDDNKTNNPRKYEGVGGWLYGTVYNVSDVVKYDREFYIYSGYGVTSSTASVVTPYLDTNNWLNLTTSSQYGWREIDLMPIQHISERRLINNLYPFNFTIDSNIDPYLVIEVNSENGYGMTYKDKKNYEIKGILDIRELESYTNLTSKQYIDETVPIVYVN